MKFRAVPEDGNPLAKAETVYVGERLVTDVPFGTAQTMFVPVMIAPGPKVRIFFAELATNVTLAV